MCTFWSSSKQISNFKLSAFFRVLFALWSLKYLHPKNQQTPRISTELEMLVNLSYFFNPHQIILQIAVDRPVENPRKRTENVNMAPNAPQQFYWRVRGQNGSLLYGRDNLIVVTYDQLILTQIQVISKLYKVKTCIMTVENDGIYLPNVILVRCPKRRKQDTI